MIFLSLQARRWFALAAIDATAKTLCKTAGWTSGNGGALGLGDMSEANGSIPGTSVGQPGHPQGTHTNGFDIDLGYYQVNTEDNHLRPICTNADYHCTAEPHLLDVWRHALFLGFVFESSRTRVIGVDGQAGTLLTAAIQQLCSDGWIDSYGCANIALAYETTDMGYGWFYFHHHHSHISLNQVGGALPAFFGGMQPMVPGRYGTPLKKHPYRLGVPSH